MGKRAVIIILAICLVALVGFTGFGVWRSTADRPSFYTDGYVLQGEFGDIKRVEFGADEPYVVTRAGYVTFNDIHGNKVSVGKESFVHLSDQSAMALSDGILLDFNDLSDNFINNYYITSGLPISSSGGVYTAETTAGTINFGENLWKLSDNKYLIQSPNLSVHFSDDDVRTTDEYVQVTVTPDGIVQILTKENLWATIQEEAFIETSSGVKVYPVAQMVEDGTYKLSLAKLSVTSEDSIVLSESETRRQIVPELKLEAIDGEDGENGENGEDGINGENGEQGIQGERGVQGEQGISGEQGANGEQGIAGEKGIAGEQGVSGQNGETGAAGTAGQTGASGADGASGASGASGSPGSAGPTGAPGPTGTPGGDGGSGKKGADAVTQSSTKAALPSMSFKNWEVTATGVSGTIQTENPDMITKLSGEDSSSSKYRYSGEIKIYNVDTSEYVHAYPVAIPGDQSTIVSGDEYPITPNEFGALIYFTTSDMHGMLTPDTNYRFSLVAHYKPEGDEKVYSREFISRYFYTDSTGVVLSADFATANSLSIQAAVASAFQEKVTKVEVLLCDYQQSQSLSTSNKDDRNSYKHKYVIDYTSDDPDTQVTYWSSGSSTPSPMQIFSNDSRKQKLPLNLKFNWLDEDTEYYARVIVTTKSGDVQLTTLTKQSLPLITLKTEPTYDKDDFIRAYYSRSTAAFEVYRPEVSDKDSGIVRYIYTAYEKKADGSWAEYVTKEISPGYVGAVNFFLPTQKDYTFGVKMEFFDNEKTIYYEIPMSDPVKSDGTTMPRVIFVDTEPRQYNKVEGDLVIGPVDLANINVRKGVTIDIYADRVYAQSITMNTYDKSFVKTIEAEGRTITLQAGIPDDYLTSTNEMRIHLMFDNLYRSTRYTVTVTGYINLGEGGENDEALFTRRTIGAVTFDTPAPPKVTAAWMPASEDPVEGESEADLQLNSIIRQRLWIKPDISLTESSSDDEIALYNEVLSELREGQIELRLSRGTGASKVQIHSVPLKDSVLQDAYGVKGALITEKTFEATAEQGQAYTLEIVRVTDKTAKLLSLGYVNTFEVSQGQSTVALGRLRPPDLSVQPNKEVTATPITNDKAGDYGGRKDPSLPDDAIVGYLVQSQYDNSERYARTVTYYAFEYSVIYNSVVQQGIDPIKPWLEGKTTQIQTIPGVHPSDLTFEVPLGSDTVPGVAIMFGRKSDKNGNVIEGAEGVGRLPNMVQPNIYAFFTGDKIGDQYATNMGRGYRYMFCYTVEYSTDGITTFQYPYYPENNYKSFAAQYGLGWERGKQLIVDNTKLIGDPVYIYIFNSGMVECPNIDPEMHSYVYKTTDQQWASGMTAGGGKIEVHYTYRDVDNTLDITRDPKPKIVCATKENGTELEYGFGATNSEDVLLSPAGSEQWYKVNLTYNTESFENVVSPKIANMARYLRKYDTIMAELNAGTVYEEVDNSFYLGHYAVDREYGDRFTKNSGDIRVTMDTTHLSNNYIEFLLVNNTGGSLAQELGRRAYAMRLTFTREDDPDGIYTNVKYLPIVSEATIFKAHLDTSDLGWNYIGKKFTVEAAVLYDTGEQGWALVERDGDTKYENKYGAPNGYFALQNSSTTSSGEGVVYRLGSYRALSSSSSGGSAPSGAIMDMNANAKFSAEENLRGMVKRKGGILKDLPYSVSGMFIAEENTTTYVYIYPTEQGTETVTTYNTSDPNYDVTKGLSGTTIVPKGVGLYPLTFTGSNNDTITTITPTIWGASPRPNATKIGMGNDFLIYSWDQAGVKEEGVYQVTAFVFTDEDWARQLRMDKALDLNYIWMTLDTEGKSPESAVKPIATRTETDSEGNTETIELDWIEDPKGVLKQDTKYYIAYAMRDKDNPDNIKILINKKTGEKAVFEVTTSSGVTISSESQLQWNNDSYFAKSLSLTYSLSRSAGMHTKFALLDGEGNVIFNHEQLVENNMISSRDGTIVFRDNNLLNISLTPSAIRKIVVPGATYSVLVEAYEGTELMNSKVFHLQKPIPPVVNCGALIRISDATENSITFNVSLYDVEKSFMGHRNYPESNVAHSLFAVRFTDKDGNRIPTTYDDQVYDGTVPMQDFVLDAEHIRGLSSSFKLEGDDPDNTPSYYIEVYAVLDAEHDGKSADVAETKDDEGNILAAGFIGQEWRYFFNEGGYEDTSYTDANPTAESIGRVFGTFIDSFWLNNLKPYGYDPNPMQANIKDTYCILSKGQRLTGIGSDGLYIDEKQATIIRRSSEQFLTVSLGGSFGITRMVEDPPNSGMKVEKQAFAQIDWYIEGYDSDGNSVKATGQVSGTDVKFRKETNLAGIEVYNFKIPDIVPKGYYPTIIVQLRTQKDVETNRPATYRLDFPPHQD